MSSYKFTYFDVRARGEVTRILFHLAGVPFEDEIVQYEDFLANKKSQLLAGQLPYLTVDGKVLYQSYTINRYLANKFGFAGKNEWEKANADMVVDLANDMVNPLAPAVIMERDPEKKTAIRKDYETNKLPTFMKALEKLLKEAEGDYFVGTEMTWADVTVMHHLQWLENKAFGITFPWAEYPKVKAFLTHMESLPKIAEYLKNRKPSGL